MLAQLFFLLSFFLTSIFYKTNNQKVMKKIFVVSLYSKRVENFNDRKKKRAGISCFNGKFVFLRYSSLVLVLYFVCR